MNNDNKTYVFLDQSGDASLKLDTEGTLPYYVLSATLSDSENIAMHWKQAKGLISKHCGKGELKSSNIGNNQKRRKEILLDLAKTGIRTYSLVVDKSEVSTLSGLKYKRSFYKFLNRTVVARLRRPYSNIEIVADKQGSDEYMNGFKSYIETRTGYTLFDTFMFRFENSQEYPLIQIADLIAGTIARIYLKRDPEDLLNIIKDNLVLIEEWPPALRATSQDIGTDQAGNYDILIRDQAVRQAKAYIIENADIDDQLIRARVAFVKFLLHWYCVVSPSSYVSSSRIRAYLKESINFSAGEQLFRSQIVGKLRDVGVIVTSSEKGFKIPNSQRDIRKYVRLVNGQILPYLRRLSMTRKQLLLATKGKYDIVDPNEYSELHKILNECNT
jgi:hypothetical protein